MAYKVAEQLDPENIWSLHDQGNVLMRVFGNPVAAEPIFRECVEKKPDFDAWLYHDLGLSLMRQNKHEEAPAGTIDCRDKSTGS